MLPTTDELARTVSGIWSNLKTIADHRDEIVPRARFIARKLPKIREGLKIIGKSDRSENLSIGHFLEANAKARPNHPAILYRDRVISHRELSEQSNRYANLYASRGIGKGDAVAIFVENRPEILFAVAGAVKLGAIAAVINTKQRKHVLTHSFTLCNARLYVIGEELWDGFDEVRGELSNATPERVLFVRDDGSREAPSDTTDVEAALVGASASTPAQLAQVTLGDPCFYIYTSGTTGLPKASIMSHFRWVKASGAFGKLALDIQPDDVMYLPLPLYHNNALTVAWSSAASVGATLAIRRKFSASKFWDDTRKFKATCFCYIGELCRYLMNQPAKPNDRDNPVIKICGNGLRPDIWKPFKERFGIEQVYEFYAASEGNIAFVNVFNFDCTIGFCPAPYALVKYDVDADEPVRDHNGHLIRVGPGEVGLLIAEVSEKYAFDGYTDKAASEKKLFRNAFEDGDCWFNSGDLLRDQGFHHAQFVDRVGDTFRWKGENVSTNEVAEVLNGFAQVSEATVYGVQIPGTDGRAGMASLVCSVAIDDLDLDALYRHMHGELPAYACPLFLRVQPELEVTGTFKQMKGDLKKQGFDPAAVHDPLFVALPGETRFSRVDGAVYQRIVDREIRF